MASANTHRSIVRLGYAVVFVAATGLVADAVVPAARASDAPAFLAETIDNKSVLAGLVSYADKHGLLTSIDLNGTSVSYRELSLDDLLAKQKLHLITSNESGLMLVYWRASEHPEVVAYAVHKAADKPFAALHLPGYFTPDASFDLAKAGLALMIDSSATMPKQITKVDLDENVLHGFQAIVDTARAYTIDRD